MITFIMMDEVCDEITLTSKNFEGWTVEVCK